MKPNISSKRRQGTVIVYVALSLVVLLGAAGLSIDASNLYLQRNKAQTAADASALAGALILMGGGDKAAADTRAEAIAKANGFDSAKNATFSSVINPTGNNPTYYQVSVTKPAPVFFMAIFGWRYKTIGAPATATYEVPVDIDINGGGEYGKNGPVTLSMFGPYAQHTYGDCYSPIYLQNNTPNPLYQTVGQYGYDFNISIPKDYATTNGTNKVDVQIFDPDTYNGNGSANAVKNESVDEIRQPQNKNPKKATIDGTANFDKDNTTTRYRLYDTKGTPQTSDDELIAEATYGDDPSTDMKWVTPDGFQFKITDPRWASRFAESGTNPVNFRMNIKTINGSSENGFNLRAGPTFNKTRVKNGVTQYRYKAPGDSKLKWHDDLPTFNPKNGTNITATGRIPMNFNSSGTATIALGTVGATATKVTITKFDTDVGVNQNSITYYDTNGNSWPGVLSAGDKWETDTILLNNYPGGDWSATYKAGTGDTSVWDMSYEGPSLSTPGGVRLVK